MTKPIPKFDINQIEKGLTDQAKSIMSMLQEGIFIIEKYCESEDKYDGFIHMIFDNMLHGFEHKEFRECPVQYKFRDDPDEEVKWLQYRHFVINIMLWRPMVMLGIQDLTEDYIIDKAMMTKMSRSFIKKYIDELYINRYNRVLSNKQMNMMLCDTIYWLSRISASFNPIIGLGANIETFIDLANRIPQFNELLYFKLDESKQPNELESELKAKTREQINLILDDEEFNILKPMLQNDAGIKPKQFSEFTLNIGLKPDIEGKTIPKPINTNYLIEGLNTIENQYKNSISGRKAAIMNNEHMGKSGYMAILVSIACAQDTLSQTTMDCDTVNPISVTINSKDELEKLDGRYYKFLGQRVYTPINAAKDSFLVGQTILLRSPVTCACKDGICATCYGDLYYTNRDLKSAGILSATGIMNPVMQGILSAKHYQDTKSNPIIFQPEFDKFLELYSTEINLNPDDYVDLSKHQLVIYIKDNLKNADGSDDIELIAKAKGKKNKKEDTDFEGDEMEFSFAYYVSEFEIWEMKDTAGLKSSRLKNRMKFSDIDKKSLFMHNDLLNKMEDGEDEDGNAYRYIPLEHLNSEEYIFMVDVQNNELTVPLKSITKLLDNKDHEDCYTYEAMVQKMLELLIRSNMQATLVHGEMIIRQLLRKKSNVLKRPNFSRIVTRNDYDILTVKTALRKNPSITTSISTNYLKKQLVEQQITFDKVSTSVFDPLFRRDLSHIDEEYNK